MAATSVESLVTNIEERDGCEECGRAGSEPDVKWAVLVYKDRTTGVKTDHIICMPCLRDLRERGVIPTEHPN